MHSDIDILAMSFQICLLRQEKQKQKQSDYIKLEIFCTAKETIIKMKRQLTEWEKILSILYLYPDSISDKGVRSKIYKEYM